MLVNNSDNKSEKENNASDEDAFDVKSLLDTDKEVITNDNAETVRRSQVKLTDPIETVILYVSS